MRRLGKSAALQPGDRLEKVDFPGSIWIVARLIETRHQLPHAVVVYQKIRSETRMLAVSTLLNEGFYRRLAAPLAPIS
ncbi:MAG: hypothetical protein H8E30_14480 [Alphaproteobacteria bacterium]|nr:hypothetical protein [Alphaproteobacteria bacterium]